MLAIAVNFCSMWIIQAQKWIWTRKCQQRQQIAISVRFQWRWWLSSNTDSKVGIFPVSVRPKCCVCWWLKYWHKILTLFSFSVNKPKTLQQCNVVNTLYYPNITGGLGCSLDGLCQKSQKKKPTRDGLVVCWLCWWRWVIVLKYSWEVFLQFLWDREIAFHCFSICEVF